MSQQTFFVPVWYLWRLRVRELRLQIITDQQYLRFYDPRRKLNPGEPAHTHDPNPEMFAYHDRSWREGRATLEMYRKLNPNCPELRRDIVCS